MILSFASRKRPSRRGVAAVEFALVAPLFIAFILGIIEFGRMMMVQEILVNAASQGTRAAIMPGQTDAQVTTIVDNCLNGAGISGYNAPTVSPTLASGPASGTALTMTVSVPCQSVSWLGGSTWFNGQTLSASIVMTKE